MKKNISFGGVWISDL